MKMSILNMECPICTEVFKTSDDIHSTSCGHIFHHDCLTEWYTRASNCPKCCARNPTSHKLYLSFDEIELISPEKTGLELKLKSLNEKHIQVLDQLNETEADFMQLQEQFTITEREKKELEGRIKEMNGSEENFLHLQGQYTESLELNKCLKDQIHELSIENESISKELKSKCDVIKSLAAELQAAKCKSPDNTQKQKIRDLEEKLKCTSAELEQEITSSTNLTLENQLLKDKINELSIENEGIRKELSLKCNVIESLRVELQAGECTSPDNIQNEKIRILEQKLKYTCTQLEKEIATSTNLTIENFKLQSYIDHFKSSGNNENIPPKKTNKKPDVFVKHENKNEKNLGIDCSDKNQKQLAYSTTNQVIIEELPSNQLTVPLENIIVNLATKMNTSITPDDLVSVKILDKNTETSSNHKLLVQFKNAQSKNEFLSKSNFLKNYPTTSSINIKEYIDDQLESLLTYAKLKLKNNGFNHIFLRNNQIFAKKHRNHPKIIPIRSKDHVDSLLNKIQYLESERNASNNLNERGIDENYYQL